MKTKILKVYDTITKKPVDIEVTPEVFDEYLKLNWRIKKKNRSFYKHEVQFSMLISNSNSSLEGFKEFVSDPEDTVDKAVNVVLTEDLKKCFHLLKPHEKKLIKMLFIDGLTEDECATRLNESRQNIHNKRSRILVKLNNLFKSV